MQETGHFNRQSFAPPQSNSLETVPPRHFNHPRVAASPLLSEPLNFLHRTPSRKHHPHLSFYSAPVALARVFVFEERLASHYCRKDPLANIPKMPKLRPETAQPMARSNMETQNSHDMDAAREA